jgi:SAM-dependent methyltransferase
MSPKLDLYNNAYGNYESDAYREVRIETYGEDLGQTSWVTSEESAEIPELLAIERDSYVLEVGCGSGGYALHLAEKVGCRILGLDLNDSGIRNQQVDASKDLPFDEDTFDAAFSNDVLCHIPGRLGVLAEIFRVLKPGGRFLFTDALVIAGMVSAEEIATRSSIGFYAYSPAGENERLMRQAGFSGIRAIDTTDNAARISKRWHHAREKRKPDLLAAEGPTTYDGLQHFLSSVHILSTENRLLRHLYFATKP